MTLTYGIYPGGRAATLNGPPSDPIKINTTIEALSGGRPFVVREYVHFLGTDPDLAIAESIGAINELDRLTMPDAWYLADGRQLDLVVSYLPTIEDVDGWLDFLGTVIDRYGPLIHFLQVTLEPNFPIPFIDGSSPAVFEALTRGIPTARDLLTARGLDHVQIGFSVAEPAEWLGGDEDFWMRLGDIPRERFADYVDYVGLAVYPDTFSPVAPEGQPGDVTSLTRHAVDHLRTHSLPLANIDDRTPIHIAENGSPSGAGRSPEEQARSLTTMLRSIDDVSRSHHVTHHELFSLRDADSGSSAPTATLGLTTDHYDRKPAFNVVRDWIRSPSN